MAMCPKGLGKYRQPREYTLSSAMSRPRSRPWAARYGAQRTQRTHCTAGLIAELDARLTERVPGRGYGGLTNFRAHAPGLPNTREVIDGYRHGLAERSNALRQCTDSHDSERIEPQRV